MSKKITNRKKCTIKMPNKFNLTCAHPVKSVHKLIFFKGLDPLNRVKHTETKHPQSSFKKIRVPYLDHYHYYGTQIFFLTTYAAPVWRPLTADFIKLQPIRSASLCNAT